MLTFRIEKAGAMENEDNQHGYNPQPIDIVPSFFHGLVSCNVSIFLDSFTSWAFDRIWTAA